MKKNLAKNLTKSILCLIILSLLPIMASAHKRWVLPSLFTVSEQQWVTFDATVSNNIFYPDRAWPLVDIQVYTPNEDEGVVENKYEGHRRSTFDVNLNQQGTFRISLGGENFFARYPKVNPKPDERPFHSVRAKSLEELKAKIPAGAKEVKLALSNSHLESYVTVGAPNTEVFKSKGSGIELKPVTHPNDLYQGEKAKFQFTVDGEAIKDLPVLMVWEGTRYRNDEQAIELKTDEKGGIEIDLTQTGRFLIEIEHSIDMPKASEYASKSFGYFGTFEVLPQ